MTLQAGTRLGAYEILSRLGAGGMGEVYRARDARLERDVAVKVLPASVANDADALARFEREAKAVAALSHPNILSIFDFGRYEGVAYVVTELLEGDTLRGKLDAGPVSQKQAVDYALQIAKGLSAAHGHGIVHRDLKPENVFVTRDGHVKILDFGLAKRVEAAKPGEATEAPTVDGQTEPGKVMGTVGYMSPEQARGLPVDHRSDIFSLGSILYELFSGRRAFKKDTPGDTLAAIIRDEPAELTATGRDVSPSLDHIVRHCLEKDPGDRFQSAKDIAFALSEASGPATVTSTVQAVPAPAGKRRTLVAAAVVVVILAGAGIMLMRRNSGGPAAGGIKRVAVLPFENLGSPEDDYFADGISDEIRGKLTSLPGIQVIARGSSTPYKKTTKTPKQIAEELNVQYLLTATVRSVKSGGTSRVYVSPELVDVSQRDAPTSKWQQRFDAALTDVFQVQSDIASQVAQALGVALEAGQEKQLAERPTKNLPAYEAFLKGEEAAVGLSKQDPPSLRKALGFYEQAVALDPRFAQAWARIAYASSVLYFNTTPTPELSERARRAAETAIALAPNDPESYSAMGTYSRVVLADYRAAQEQFARGRNLAPGNADLMRDAALVEKALGQWDAALEHLRDAQRLDPRSVSVSNQLARVLLFLRRYPEALQAVDAGLALSPDNLSLIERRAMTFLGEGNLAGARAYLGGLPESVEPTELVAFLATYWDLGWVLTEEQKEILLRLTPAAFDDDRGNWALSLAQVLWWRGDAAQTRKYAEEARKAFEDQLRAAPDDPQRHAVLGVALGYLGRSEEAIREGERAVELRPVAKDADYGTYYLHLLVRTYILAGQPEKAIDNLERLLQVPHYISPPWLKIDPNFDPLRGNPRFQKLVARAK
jgi:TolB-like protein/Flp pilus assembly protein TadD